MRLEDAKIGTHIIHDTDPTLSGLVVGVDEVGLPRPPGSCVWLKTPGRKAWLLVGQGEIQNYSKQEGESLPAATEIAAEFAPQVDAESTHPLDTAILRGPLPGYYTGSVVCDSAFHPDLSEIAKRMRGAADKIDELQTALAAATECLVIATGATEQQLRERGYQIAVDTRREIDRLREELTGARTECFRHGYVVDCDEDDPDAVAEADDLRTLCSWIAQSESAARDERDRFEAAAAKHQLQAKISREAFENTKKAALFLWKNRELLTTDAPTIGQALTEWPWLEAGT